MGEEIEIFMAGVFKRFRQPNAIRNSEATKIQCYIQTPALHPYKIIHFSILTTCVF